MTPLDVEAFSQQVDSYQHIEVTQTEVADDFTPDSIDIRV